jgi:hypothetical protein
VGTIVAAGCSRGDQFIGKHVFTFSPHGSHAVLSLPDTISSSSGSSSSISSSSSTDGQSGDVDADTAAALPFIQVPTTVSASDAAFLPSIETALSLCHDAAPLLNERVAVVGQVSASTRLVL